MNLTERQIQRFFNKVERIPEGCWIWKGWVNSAGYGRVRIKSKNYRAHRVSYTILKGEIAEGLVVDHLCRVHSCVNPDHLEAVTDRENLMRGKTLAAANVKKTHCSKGHPYDEENTTTHMKKNGFPVRWCKACERLKQKNYYWKKKQMLKVEQVA